MPAMKSQRNWWKQTWRRVWRCQRQQRQRWRRQMGRNAFGSRVADIRRVFQPKNCHHGRVLGGTKIPSPIQRPPYVEGIRVGGQIISTACRGLSHQGEVEGTSANNVGEVNKHGHVLSPQTLWCGPMMTCKRSLPALGVAQSDWTQDSGHTELLNDVRSLRWLTTMTSLIANAKCFAKSFSLLQVLILSMLSYLCHLLSWFFTFVLLLGESVWGRARVLSKPRKPLVWLKIRQQKRPQVICYDTCTCTLYSVN